MSPFVQDVDDPATLARREQADRGARRQQAAIAVLLSLLALGLPLFQHPDLWPIAAVGAVISGLLLWGALRDESVAAPVVSLILTAVVSMFVGDAPAIGGLASVVVAISLGEHLAAAQHSRYATPGHATGTLGFSSAAVHGAVAAAAMTLTMVAALLPQSRWWSAAAVVALAVVAAIVQRRRAALASHPLPPPEQVA